MAEDCTPIDYGHYYYCPDWIDLCNQKRIIRYEFSSRNMKKGESRYLVDKRWFRQWKKYVGYEYGDDYNLIDQADHPGPIDNSSLFKPVSTILRDNLVHDVDYILLRDREYKMLATFYGKAPGQEPIIRKVIEQGMFVKHCKVEVYLMELKLCENSDPTTVITHAFSLSDTISTIEQEMRKLFSIPDDKEVRLWNHYVRNTFQQLNKNDITLEEAGLYQGQVVVIEAKNKDGTWPRENKSALHVRHEVTTRMDSAVVKKVLSLDVPKKMVQKAIRKRLMENGEDFTTAEALLEAVFRDTEDAPKAALSELADKDDLSALASGDGENPDSMQLAEENGQLNEQRLCKICMDEEVCVTFIPCGHLVTCSVRASVLKQCPICQVKIRGTLHTYLS